MGLKDKIVSALREPLDAAFIRLEDDDGMSGFVVSRRFEGMSSMDRQTLIDHTLSHASLTVEEGRRVLLIVGLTPREYDEVGANIVVRKIKELPGGLIEVRVEGSRSDAEYVRGALANLKGVQTFEPKQVKGPTGVLMSFRAKGPNATPLAKDKVIRVLKEQPYVLVMPSA